MRFILEIDGNNKISENLEGQSVSQDLLMEQAEAPHTTLNPAALQIETEEIKVN